MKNRRKQNRSEFDRTLTTYFIADTVFIYGKTIFKLALHSMMIRHCSITHPMQLGNCLVVCMTIMSKKLERKTAIGKHQ